jgi:hypothetical protein
LSGLRLTPLWRRDIVPAAMIDSLRGLMTSAAVWLGAHPGAWCVAFLPVFLPLCAWARTSDRAAAWLSQPRPQWAWLGVLPVAGYLWLSWRYAFFPQHGDLFEPLVSDVAWYFWTGKPVYHAANAVECYSMVYGPNLYLFTGVFEGWFGPSVLASKLGGVLAAHGTLAGLFWLLRRHGSLALAFIGTGLFALLNLHFGTMSFWLRPDPYLTLFVALGYVAAGSPARLAPIGLGIAMGICVNLKVHTVLYFLPAVAWVITRGVTGRQVLMSIAAAVVTVFLPFVLFANISLAHYLETIRGQAKHGLDAGVFRSVVEWFFALLLPWLVMGLHAWQAARREAGERLRAARLILAGLLGGGLLLAVPASKFGAGPHHFVAYGLVVILMSVVVLKPAPGFVWSRSWAGAVACALTASWFLSLTLTSFLTGKYIAFSTGGAARQSAAAVVEDVRAVVARQGKDHVLLMGAAGNAQLGQLNTRPWLVFGGAPIGLDPAALMDFKRSGEAERDLETFARAIKQREGRSLMWLVPRGAEPFFVQTFYPPYDDLYGAKFRADFARLFVRLESSAFYDLYVEVGEARAVADAR